MASKDYFSGKRVYITGGSSGIGLAAAEQLAAGGADVLLLARDESRLKAAADRVEANRRGSGRQCAWYCFDVTDEPAVTRTIDRAAAEFGPPDILIACAGGARPDYFDRLSAARFDYTIQVNLYGTRHVVAAALPHMPKLGGHIVTIASVAGLLGVFGYTDYSAAKFAIVGFAEALRAELRPLDVNVSVLCPPDTDTPGLTAENLSKPAETSAISQSARTLSPEKVARVMLKGVRRRKFLIIPGFDAKLSVLAKRFCPKLVFWVMDRTVARLHKNTAQKEHAS
ncbi:MAG: SDR family oxidoreductase [Desulfosudaceae bacterium]